MRCCVVTHVLDLNSVDLSVSYCMSIHLQMSMIGNSNAIVGVLCT